MGCSKLWCWIDDNWSSLRIFTYYMPIWVCILLSGVIYFAVGYQVFHQRNQLRNLTLSNPGKEESSCEIRDSAEKVSLTDLYFAPPRNTQNRYCVMPSALPRPLPKTPIS